MKRKLAFLLAAVMVIAALPMNVFAASTNSITKVTSAEEGTVFLESKWAGVNETGDIAKAANTDSGQDYLEYWVDGTDLKIVLNDSADEGRTFKLELENAKWFFRQKGNSVATTTYGAGYLPKAVTKSDFSATFSNLEDSVGFEVVIVTPLTLDAITQNSAITAAMASTYAAALDSDPTDFTFNNQPIVTGNGGYASNNANAFGPAVKAELDEKFYLEGIKLNANTGSIIKSNVAGNNGVIPTSVINNMDSDDWDDKLEDAKIAKENFLIVDDTAVTEGYYEFLYNVLTEIANSQYSVYYDGTNYWTFQKTSSDTSTQANTYALVKANSYGALLTGAYKYTYNLPITYMQYKANSVPQSGTPTTGTGYVFSYRGTGWPTQADPANAGATTFNPNNGVFNFNEAQRYYTYTRYNSDGTLNATDEVADGKSEVGYSLVVVVDGNETVATITTNQPAVKDAVIRIPLVILTTGGGDYRVKVTSNITEVASGNLLIGSEPSGKTNATIASKDVNIKRNEIVIEKLSIAEAKLGSLAGGKYAFEIKAPRGYYFDNKLTNPGDPATNGVSSKEIGIYTEGGLLWKSSSKTGLLQDDAITMNYKINSRSSDTDYSSIVVQVAEGTLSQSYNVLGSLYFTNLRLVAEDDDSIPFGEDVYLSLSNFLGKYNNGNISYTATKLTEQDVKIGTVRDYEILLTATTAVPELVSGRLEGFTKFNNATPAKYSEVNLANGDKYHQAATVKFEERVPDAWWAQRNTVFTLPEEVRFMKVDFRSLGASDSKLESAAIDSLTKGTNADTTTGTATTGQYYNTRNRRTNVTIDNNKLTMTNLAVQANEKAVFTMRLWLSIRADYEGDIDLTLDNTALKYSTVNEEEISVTIAKAIKPVEIETKVTEAKVGYQYVSVADFDIKETKAGNLLKGYKVYVTVTDQITLDMAIAKGFGAAITEGNMKIKDVDTTSLLGRNSISLDSSNGAQLSFVIDKESTVASTISFTNVQVKIDRSVAYSNLSNNDDRGIDIYAWGPAIANNYYYLHTAEIESFDDSGLKLNGNDLFNVAGISEKYINVVTLAADSNQSAYTNNVTVTMGSTSYTINGAEYTLEVAPYVSTASNSAMVPLRFVAYALGLSESAVKWDAATSVATVDAGTRVVAFQTGAAYYWVNGTQVPMVSPDGLPVEMEITGERAFVPFRALGEAFNIVVDWDAATSTAIYNAPTVQ